MSARIGLCLAAALLMAAAGSAGADSYQPSVGSASPSSASSAAGLPSATANHQAITTDRYNQSDFSNQQSFGLTASQMLGAAAACEQLHSDRISMGDRQLAKAGQGSSEEERTELDTAQQYMLDPAATLPAGEADCDRVSASYSRLQQIQIQNQSLSKISTSRTR